MVHSALLNVDIVSIICESLHQKSLSALARTARYLQDPALRELWRDIRKFSHLLSPFDSCMNQDRGKISFSNDLTSAQWERFRFYARYVRNLCIAWDDDIELSSLQMLLSHQPLLPRLRTLVVHRSWPDEGFFALSMFFVASIQKFVILCCRDLPALEYLVTQLGTTAPALQHLRISVSSTAPWQFGTSISGFDNLYSIDIPLTDLRVHTVLAHLSTLRSLSSIRFSINTGLARESGRGPRYAFPAARELDIDSKSDDYALYLMALTQFDNLNNLAISCDDYQMDASLLFKAISVSCGRFLNQIRISGGGESLEPMFFSALSPLFKFTNLRFFSLSTEQTFEPTDDDIQGIVKSWSNLEEFRVNPYFEGDNPSPAITLTGLLLLIEQCASLMKILIAVDATDIPDLASSINRPGLTIEIEPWHSPIDCPKSLADFLNLALPDADIKLVLGSESENWEEAISLRQFFIKGRQEGEKHAITQIRELQVALDECRMENARLCALGD